MSHWRRHDRLAESVLTPGTHFLREAAEHIILSSTQANPDSLRERQCSGRGLILSGRGSYFFAARPLGRFDSATAHSLRIDGKTPQNAS